MKRLLPRIPRRRPQAPQATEATQGRPSEVARPPAPPAAPAGAEAPDLAAAPRPSFHTRGKLRRRLRFLRRVRELGLRDVGGLVFDQYRFNRPNDELVRHKLAALAAVDVELRALERALNEPRPVTELREPGISACPRCGTVHASEARFCPSCGLALSGARAITDVGEGPHPALEGGASAISATDKAELEPAPGDGDGSTPRPVDRAADGTHGAEPRTTVARPADRGES